MYCMHLLVHHCECGYLSISKVYGYVITLQLNLIALLIHQLQESLSKNFCTGIMAFDGI